MPAVMDMVMALTMFTIQRLPGLRAAAGLGKTKGVVFLKKVEDLKMSVAEHEAQGDIFLFAPSNKPEDQPRLIREAKEQGSKTLLEYLLGKIGVSLKGDDVDGLESPAYAIHLMLRCLLQNRDDGQMVIGFGQTARLLEEFQVKPFDQLDEESEEKEEEEEEEDDDDDASDEVKTTFVNEDVMTLFKYLQTIFADEPTKFIGKIFPVLNAMFEDLVDEDQENLKLIAEQGQGPKVYPGSKLTLEWQKKELERRFDSLFQGVKATLQGVTERTKQGSLAKRLKNPPADSISGYFKYLPPGQREEAEEQYRMIEAWRQDPSTIGVTREDLREAILFGEMTGPEEEERAAQRRNPVTGILGTKFVVPRLLQGLAKEQKDEVAKDLLAWNEEWHRTNRAHLDAQAEGKAGARDLPRVRLSFLAKYRGNYDGPVVVNELQLDRSQAAQLLLPVIARFHQRKAASAHEWKLVGLVRGLREKGVDQRSLENLEKFLWAMPTMPAYLATAAVVEELQPFKPPRNKGAVEEAYREFLKKLLSQLREAYAENLTGEAFVTWRTPILTLHFGQDDKPGAFFCQNAAAEQALEFTRSVVKLRILELSIRTDIPPARKKELLLDLALLEAKEAPEYLPGKPSLVYFFPNGRGISAAGTKSSEDKPGFPEPKTGNVRDVIVEAIIRGLLESTTDVPQMDETRLLEAAKPPEARPKMAVKKAAGKKKS
ncbi:MAG: hypothetical protein V1821_00465 [bacterium]